MILDTDRDASWLPERIYDVCVCGAGPAGITLARRLAARGCDVALMEAGGFGPSAESTDAYRGDSVGIPFLPLHVGRLRYFGGTSNHWTGHAPALDAVDYRPRPDCDLDGWPFGREELDQYADEAGAILESRVPEHAHDPLGFDGKDELRAVAIPLSPPVRFSAKYRREIERSDRIWLHLHANLVDFAFDPDRRGVTGARFRPLRRKQEFVVRARHYALCLGGIENARLLLNCRARSESGLGNETGLVGRFFCDHPHVRIGWLLYDRQRVPAFAGERYYAPTEGFIAREQVLNYCLRLPGTAMASGDGLGARLREAACSTEFIRALAAAIGSAPFDCGNGAGPGLLPIEGVFEQAPNPDSRVTLTDALDAFGLCRARLDWRVGALDLRTMRVAVTQIGRRFAASDLGRVQMAPWLVAEPPYVPERREGFFGGSHHIGTTRMADHPRAGVVDRDGRLFGAANLYVGGSSVFPRSGWANPTYTIVQLALRLGDHLAARVKG
ncbi:MAG: GMC oxidoreductase [Alphaproteobacteria bacterium]|nr:GMC oxidoreductase [Alphaproteobacteria bacterium]